jgi:hypothetical protein
MARQITVWSPTGGLFAIAFAVLILGAITLSGVFASARYQFAARATDGQMIWRGDTITGRVVFCVLDYDFDKYTSGFTARGQPTDQFKRC